MKGVSSFLPFNLKLDFYIGLGVTFNTNEKNCEFIIHNDTGDLHYKCKDYFQLQ